MLDDIDEMSEYQQAVERLNGMHLNQVNFREIIEAFQSVGIYYSARDTRRMDPDSDNMATVIYGCSQ